MTLGGVGRQGHEGRGLRNSQGRVQLVEAYSIYLVFPHGLNSIKSSLYQTFLVGVGYIEHGGGCTRETLSWPGFLERRSPIARYTVELTSAQIAPVTGKMTRLYLHRFRSLSVIVQGQVHWS